MPPPEARSIVRPLDVEAALSLVDAQGEEITVNADGRAVRVEFRNLRIPLRLVRGLADRRQRARWAERFHAGACAADLDVEFWVSRRVVAELTPRSHSSVWARMLGLGPIRLRPLNILRCLLTR